MDPWLIVFIVSSIILVASLLVMVYGRSKGYYKPKTCSICGRPTGLLRNRRFKLKDGCVCQECILRFVGQTRFRIAIKWLPPRFFMRTGTDTVYLIRETMRLKDEMGEELFWQQFDPKNNE